MHRASAAFAAPLLLLGISIALPVFAARPFATDDAGVIAQGECEFELAQDGQRATGTESTARSVAQLACGVGATTQLGFAGEWLASGSAHWPLVAVTGKTALRPFVDGAAGISVSYALQAEKRPAEGFRQSGAVATLIASEAFGRMLVHANLGVSHDRASRSDTALWGVAVEWIGDRFDVGAETFGENSRSLWLGSGVRYTVLARRFIVDGAVAVQANSARARRATLGLKFAF